MDPAKVYDCQSIHLFLHSIIIIIMKVVQKGQDYSRCCFYLKNKKPTMLLVHKKNSYDQSFKGDFNLNSKKEILRQKNNRFIFTGAQIIDRSIFKKRKIKPFSMNKVWDELIKNKSLLGVLSGNKFFHINNYKIYKKLNKKIIG